MNHLQRVLALAVVLIVAPLHASADDLEDARVAFEQGIALLDDQRFAESAAAFERSIESHETVGALYNWALALRGLGQLRVAIAGLERVLELAPATDEVVRSNTSALLEELLARIAHVRLTVTGEPDSLLVDGVAADRSAGELRLDPGSHVISTRRAGYEDQSVEVELEVGGRSEVSIDASSVPLAARLDVTVTPAEGLIEIDGSPRGVGPLQVMLPAGDHTVRIVADGFAPYERELELARGATERLLVELVAQSGVAGEAWFWVLIVGAAALVGGGVGLGVYFAQPEPVDYDGGSIDRVLYNLSLAF